MPTGIARKRLGRIAAFIILGLVLVAFVVTGFGTHTSPFAGIAGSSSVAKIGRTDLTATALKAQADRAVRNARQRDPSIDMAGFLASGSFDRLLDEMIQAQALATWARDNGFYAGKRLIDGEIASLPAFQLAGKFDQHTYQQALRGQHISERELRENLEDDVLRRQLLVPVGAGALAPTKLARTYASLMVEQRKGRMGFVPTVAFLPNVSATPEQVKAFYQKEVAHYTLPERRSLRFALFGPEQVAAAAKPSEEEIAAFYKANAASYSASSVRTLAQVLFQDEAAAKALAAKVRTGTSFDKAAADANFTPTDTALGERTRKAYAAESSAAVANAVFDAASTGIVGPIKSDYGWHVVNVERIRAMPGKTLASVHAEIADSLTKQKSEEALAALDDKIEGSINDGGTFDEIVKANGLTVVTVPPITSQGRNLDDPAYRTPPEVSPLLKAVFAMEQGDDPSVETLPGATDTHYALVVLTDIVAAAPVPFDKISERVKGDYVARQAFERAGKSAESIATRVKEGQPFERLLADAKLPPPQPIGARRLELAASGNQVPPPLKLLFAMPRGGVRVLPAPQGQGWVIVKMDELIPADAAKTPGLVEATRSQFGQVLGEEYAQQFVGAAGAEIGIKRNAKVIAQLKADLSSAAPGQ